MIISIILFANQDTMCVVPNSETKLMIKNMRQAKYTPVSTAVGDWDQLGLEWRPPSQTNKMNGLNKAVTLSLTYQNHWKMEVRIYIN